MAILLKTTSVRVSSLQIMQVRVQNKGKSVWKSRYDGDVSTVESPDVFTCSPIITLLRVFGVEIVLVFIDIRGH